VKYYLASHAGGRRLVLLLGDAVTLFLAFVASYALRIYINEHWHLSLGLLSEKISPWLLLVLVPNFFTLYLLGLYDVNRISTRFRTVVLIILSVLLAGIVIGSIFFFVPRYVFGRQVLLIFLLVASLFLVTWRILISKVGSGPTVRRMAVIGSHEKIDSFAREVTSLTSSGIVVSAICCTNADATGLYDAVRYDTVDGLLAADNYEILAYDPIGQLFSDTEIQSIIEKKYQGKVVFDLPSLYKNLTGKIPLSYIDGNWLLRQEGMQGYVSKPYVYVKRLLDLTLAALLLVLLAPVGVLVALAIKLDSRGPVIFSQKRIGMHRVPFNCLKFRTMVQDAEKVSGPVWSSEDDPRITRIGRVLRKSRLDELPQLWNIIKGDLSFVGPRPIRQHFADRLSKQIPFYNIRFSVQPGLSGWAQVNFDYAGSEKGQQEKFEYELFYIQNMSFFLDVLTIIKTIRSVVRGEGQ